MHAPEKPFAFGERIVLFFCVWLFWGVVYYGVSLIPVSPQIIAWDPVWSLPYVAAFVVPYTSTYVMPLVLLAVPCDRRTFRRIVACLLTALFVSAPMFVLLPLVPPRATALGDGLLDRLLALQYALDVDGNCFPSLHVTLAFITAFAVGKCLPRLRPAMLVWAALVAVSTVLVRQHYVVDAAAGIVIATVIWRVAFRRASL
jgi:membrane-associated phospholipid phosphatase